MQLPFTKEQFFDLFAAYNEGLWPALMALWIASVWQRAAALVAALPIAGSALSWQPLGWSASRTTSRFFRESTRPLGCSRRSSSCRPLSSSGWESCRGVFRLLLGATRGRRWRGSSSRTRWSTRHQCGPTFQFVENPNVRRPMPDDDLHGRRADARYAAIMAPVDHSCDLVRHRRVRGEPAWRTRRLRPPNRRHCTGDLLDAEEQRLLGIAKRAESASARDTDISK